MSTWTAISEVWTEIGVRAQLLMVTTPVTWRIVLRVRTLVTSPLTILVTGVPLAAVGLVDVNLVDILYEHMMVLTS